MMAPSRDNLALQMHAAVETLISAPSIDAFNRVSKMLATLSASGLHIAALDEATEIANSICDRYERIKKIGVSNHEAEILRTRAGQLDVMLATVPVNVFKAARAVVETNFEAMYRDLA